MNKLSDLTESFVKIQNWEELVQQNFDRKSGIYSYAVVSRIEVIYDKKKYFYPTKIIFESGHVKSSKKVIKTESLKINNLKVKIIERKEIIALGFFKRDKKYSGDIYEIIIDIVGKKSSLLSKFSNDLLPLTENTLYGIDSKLKWPSYILVLNKKNESESIIDENENLELKDILDDYGVHYSYDSSLKDNYIIIFPLPYVKIVENKVRRNGDRDSIFLVLEFNQLGIFYIPGIRIEIESIIKNTKQEVIHEKTETLIFNKASYQVVEIQPENSGQISYSSIVIKMNGNIVEKTAGYYIRDIKIDVKIK
jgi:hypothetical protein